MTSQTEIVTHDADNEAVQDLIAEVEQLIKLNNEESIREERFVKGVFCPHCKVKCGKKISNFVCYGFVNGTGWRRYQCRQCERIFSDLTGTLFHRSRNIHKWPRFIKLLLVDQLSFKKIATELELHINTIYTWNKKLSAFFELSLPNKQFQPSDRQSYEFTTILVKRTNKGNSANNNAQPEEMPVTTRDPFIPITIAVHRENPSRILFATHQNIDTYTPDSRMNHSEKLSKIINEFQIYQSKRRGVASSYLSAHLTYFRMLKHMEAVNPVILPLELFKLCLDKCCLSDSNRLLKRFIL